VPREALRVEEGLARFEACHHLLRTQLQLEAGAYMRLSTAEAAEARVQWGVNAVRLQLLGVSPPQRGHANRNGRERSTCGMGSEQWDWPKQ
jgi:hypothetical protein